MKVVVNSSPLISLARIGHFQLLHSLYQEVSIPVAVQEEIATGGVRPGATETKMAPWVHVVAISNPRAVQMFRKRLDAGESEAIVLATELNADVLLMDEWRGRRIAESLGLNTSGTLGTLVLAKKRGLLVAVRPLLEALITSGFRVTRELFQTVLSQADEVP